MRFVALISCATWLTIAFATDCGPQCSQCDGGKCAACNPGYKLDVASNGCMASCIGKAAEKKPKKPATPFEYNGQAWPELCLDAKTAHFFSIGDWGGSGAPGHTWENPGKCKQRRCGEADSWAQKYVARQMKIVAKTSKPDYILNVGDNFYPGGITVPCGAKGSSNQWSQQFDKVYKDPNLDKAPWMSVLGNHDYGGRNFKAGWDHQVYETWKRENWLMPGQFWRRKVQYSDFSVEYFFLDSNHLDARSDPNHRICQGGGTCYHMTAKSCPTTLGKAWKDGIKMLEEGLKASTSEWHIVVTHFPQNTGGQLFQHLNQAYGIDLIVAGHAHYQGRSNSHGIESIITGGGGGVTSDIGSSKSGHDDSYGFVDFSINRTHLRYDMHSWGGLQDNGNVVIRRQITIDAHKKKPAAEMQAVLDARGSPILNV